MRAFIIVTALVALSVFCGYWISKTSEPQPISSSRPVTKYRLPQKVTRLYQAPREQKIVPSLSSLCQTFLKNISALDLSTDFQMPDSKNCKLPPPLDSFQSLASQSCAQKGENCRYSLYQLRAQITHFSTKDVPLSSIRDPKILMDKLMATFDRDPELATLIADRMVELEPDNYPAYKAGFLAKLSSPDFNTNDPNHPIWTELESRRARLEQLEPADQLSHAELDILLTIKRDKNPDRVLEKCSEVDSQFPKEGAGPYCIAWVENEKGNRESALSYLKECLRREPNNPRCQSTFQIMESADPGKKLTGIFTMHQSFPGMPTE